MGTTTFFGFICVCMCVCIVLIIFSTALYSIVCTPCSGRSDGCTNNICAEKLKLSSCRCLFFFRHIYLWVFFSRESLLTSYWTDSFVSSTPFSQFVFQTYISWLLPIHDPSTTIHQPSLSHQTTDRKRLPGQHRLQPQQRRLFRHFVQPQQQRPRQLQHLLVLVLLRHRLERVRWLLLLLRRRRRRQQRVQPIHSK
jgi:hypothetical protein